MAGGSGERFWPVSRRSKPKQFVEFPWITRTLFEHAVANISPLFTPDDIYVVTGKHQIASVLHSDAPLSQNHVLGEPFKRNTSGCIAMAAADLLSVAGDDPSAVTMGVFPADHFIGNPDRFRILVRAALTAAENEKALITFGNVPDRPETGYGYIETSGGAVAMAGGIPVHRAARFHEKPDSETARVYMDSGTFFWNSGMFFWRLSTLLDELGHTAPGLLKAIEELAEARKSGDRRLFSRIFRDIKPISIDYALMEKARNVLVLISDFGWDDIGTWDSFDRIGFPDENGNLAAGEPVIIDARNCIVYNDAGQENISVGVLGVDGLAVVVTSDGVLVIPKDRAQDVRAVVSELARRKSKSI